MMPMADKYERKNMIRRLIPLVTSAMFSATLMFAQMAPPGGPTPAAMPDCKAMMQQHEDMQKHMAEMNAKLQSLVDDMNRVKGSAKVDKIAAVINELVTQRAMMQKQMMDMQPAMMNHMMEHMKSGMMKGMTDSMSGCPMMKEGEKPAQESENFSTMNGYITNIEEQTLKNLDFRRVLFTAPHSQLVLMSLKAGEDIGKEIHKVDQFIRIERGDGKVILNGKESAVHTGFAFVIPAGTEHNVKNTGAGELKLYTIYSPPQHRDGTIHKTKAEAEKDEGDHP